MTRCLELALLGSGHTAPNPMVGAVLVHEDRVIGEGYHRQYGQAHAEVNCLASVKGEDRPLIQDSTLYVSLEPCAHFGKTPPCADLIIREKIPRVVVGCRDPFPEVDGKGIERLQAAGVEVLTGVLEKECIALNKRFFIFHTKYRPYILLKWAQTANGKIAGPEGARMLISNEYTNRLTHKWRAEEAAILVGTNTALLDDPSLTTRLWTGPDPIRLVIDKELRLPGTLKLFDGQVRTIVFNHLRHDMEGYESEERGIKRRIPGAGDMGKLYYYQLARESPLVQQIAQALYQLKILSVMVEGGAMLLQSFLDAGYWDEARVITNREMLITGGLPAPILEDAVIRHREELFSDSISWYENPIFS
jgi:diaminohydroxyphosphoribosylaminopyrimidine deaminase/5-amino-6-(5-phosphoribosylamino)uracil reductase